MPTKKGGKKKKKGKKKAGQAVAVPADKVAAFITYVFCEAKKFSINSYKKWSNELKIEFKILKNELAKLEPLQYGMIRDIIEGTDMMELTIRGIYSDQTKFDYSLNVDLDTRICDQRTDIADAHRMIHTLEEKLFTFDQKQLELSKFSNCENFQHVWDAELKALKHSFEDTKEKRKVIIHCLYEKHEHSLELTTKRAEMIISDVETVATQFEIDSLSAERIQIMNTNRDLKKRLELMLKEYSVICNKVDSLSTENSDLVKKNIGVDWNFIIWNEDNQDDPSNFFDDEDKQDDLLEMGWMNHPLSDDEDVETLSECEDHEEQNSEAEQEQVYNRSRKYATSKKKKSSFPSKVKISLDEIQSSLIEKNEMKSNFVSFSNSIIESSSISINNSLGQLLNGSNSLEKSKSLKGMYRFKSSIVSNKKTFPVFTEIGVVENTKKVKMIMDGSMISAKGLHMELKPIDIKWGGGNRFRGGFQDE